MQTELNCAAKKAHATAVLTRYQAMRADGDFLITAMY